ncbi:hypothetical protein MRB53_026504 [Persea americana]|uniref:Uncharacterized protein n=1 Tax=Persea americana TaxID=3435 RepID=A0ACC2LJ12_PERAE|nr:hypothetical protein MRB53_026504 [Persea americana]
MNQGDGERVWVAGLNGRGSAEPEPIPISPRASRPYSYSASSLCGRFIPNRSSIDLDMARYLLVDARKGKENKNKKAASPLQGAYWKHLAETKMMDRTRILSFWRKPPAPTNTNGNFQEETVLANLVKSSQEKRYIP